MRYTGFWGLVFKFIIIVFKKLCMHRGETLESKKRLVKVASSHQVVIFMNFDFLLAALCEVRQEGGVCGAGLPAGAALEKDEVVWGCTGRDVFSAGGKTLPCARCCPNPGWEGRAWLWYPGRVMRAG